MLLEVSLAREEGRRLGHPGCLPFWIRLWFLEAPAKDRYEITAWEQILNPKLFHKISAFKSGSAEDFPGVTGVRIIPQCAICKNLGRVCRGRYRDRANPSLLRLAFVCSYKQVLGYYEVLIFNREKVIAAGKEEVAKKVTFEEFKRIQNLGGFVDLVNFPTSSLHSSLTTSNLGLSLWGLHQLYQ